MYFLDETNNLAKNCPNCSASFSLEKGANCPLSCPAKQLELKHERMVPKMITHCLPQKKIIFISPKTTPIVSNRWKWGWTDDIKKIIYIPWYTLRSKKEFFETVPHEIGHITAYEELFNLSERNIIHTFDVLRLRYKTFPSWLTKSELGRYYIRYQNIIDKYQKWDGHDPNPWHKEYLKFHEKLVNSVFVEFSYGDTTPHAYGFDKHGKGHYKP